VVDTGGFKQLSPREAVRAISQGKTTLISTGTGSGKTECFLYPIISHCLQLKDDHAPAGITSIIVYPMPSQKTN